MDQFKSYSELIVGCIIYGSVGIFLNGIHDMGIGSIVFYRLSIGLIGILTYLALNSKLGELRLRDSNKKKYLFGLGILNAITMYLYFTSIKFIGASVAVLLLYTAPVYVVLLSPSLLNKKMTSQSVIALIFCIAGIFMISQPDRGFENFNIGGKFATGLLIGIFSGISYAFLIFTVGHIKDDFSGISRIFWVTVVGIIMFSPYAGSVSMPVLHDNLYALVLFGLLLSSIGILLYFNGLAKVDPHKGSIISLLEPVCAIVFSYFVLHEALTNKIIIGCALILAGAFIAVKEKTDYGIPEDDLV